jgi:hypothetical protein
MHSGRASLAGDFMTRYKPALLGGVLVYISFQQYHVQKKHGGSRHYCGPESHNDLPRSIDRQCASLAGYFSYGQASYLL